MGAISVTVNGRAYVVGCEDGQEANVEALARQFDAHVREVGGQVGQVGETRLFLMAALLTADELVDVKARLAEAEAALARYQAQDSAIDARVVHALDAAAERIEALAARV